MARPSSGMEPPCSCPSPALRGADVSSDAAPDARTIRSSGNRSTGTMWWRLSRPLPRRTACAALALLVVLASALPTPTAGADRTASAADASASATIASSAGGGALPDDEERLLVSHSREEDDADEYVDRHHARRFGEDGDSGWSERRHHGRHPGGGPAGGRGARKHQRRKQQPSLDEEVRQMLADERAGHTGCSLCREREAVRNWSLAKIQEQILHKLNLQHPPNVTGKRVPAIPPEFEAAMKQDEQRRRGHVPTHGMLGDDPGVFQPTPEAFDEEDDYHAKVQRIIAFPQTHSNKVRHNGQGQHVLHFRFSSKVMQSQVAKATLWLFVRGTGRPARRQQRPGYEDPARDEDEDAEEEDQAEEGDEDEKNPMVTVSVMRMRGRGAPMPDSPVPFEVEATSRVEQPGGEGVWITVDVKKMVEDWFRKPRDNLGLMVHATGHLVNTDPNEEENSKMPFIEVYLKEGRKRRVRRSVGLSCNENSDESRCCRYPLVVDFERFGWDFIIFPKRYNANYCSGECPYIYLQKYPHTALTGMVMNKTANCCAPKKMSAINMLYFDNDLNVIFGSLPGMVVERCGCF